MTEVSVQNAVPNPCMNCPSRCCRDYLVCLTHSDVKRIYEETGSLASIAFIPANEVRGASVSSFFIQKGKRLEEFYICLAHKPDSSCIFEDHDRCRIYGARPMPCRIYPFEPSDKPGGDPKQKRDSRCPMRWNSRKDEQEAKALIEQDRREIKEYGILCREWNATRRGGKQEDFLRFMIPRG